MSNGKYVSPQGIENMMKESLYIGQVMVIGEGEKFTSALISPNIDALKNWCSERKIGGSVSEKIEHPEVKKLYHELINQFNNRLNQDEKVKRHKLVADEWTPLTGELSPTLKLKRKVLHEKYDSIIKDIFRN